MRTHCLVILADKSLLSWGQLPFLLLFFGFSLAVPVPGMIGKAVAVAGRIVRWIQ